MGCPMCRNPEFSLTVDHLDFHPRCQSSNGEACIPCKELQDLERQMCEAKAMLEKMQKRYHDLKAAVNQMHDPIARLPPEITSTAFQFYVEGNFDPLWNDHPQNPLILGAVSHAWRAVAWSTPQLWTAMSLIFYFPGVSPMKVESLFQLAQQWLGRTGQLPISIVFKTDFDYSVLETRQMYAVLHPIIDLIKQYYSRWAHIYISVSPILLPCFFHKLRGGSMIQTLRLTSASVDAPFSGLLFTENLRLVPSEITMANIELQSVTTFWDNLTFVRMCDFRVDECLELVRHAWKLKNCYFGDIQQPSDHFPFPVNPIVHHHLKSLELAITPECEQSNLLDLFLTNTELPSLESLSWDVTRNGDSLKSTVLESFLNRSSCRLLELVANSRSQHDDLFRILWNTPHLKSFRFQAHQRSSHEVDEFLRLLGKSSLITSKDPEHEAFLPSLESLLLCVEISDLLEFGWDVVPNIFGLLSEVESNRRRPLKCLHISLDHWAGPSIRLSPSVLSQLLELRVAGIDLGLFENGRDLIPSQLPVL